MKDFSKEADDCYDLVIKTVNKDIDINNVVYFVTKTMEIVENLNIEDMVGEQKKQLVIAIIEKIIQESGLDDEKKILLQTTIKLLLPGIIDCVVAASSGLIDINQLKENGCSVSCIPSSKKK